MTDDTEAARALLEAFGFDRKAGFCLACGFQIEAGLHTPECVVGKLREPLQAALAQARAEGARAEQADLVKRLEWWLDGNLWERATGRPVNLLNPATVLGWIGAGHSEAELQERLAAIRARAGDTGEGRP